VCPDIGAEMAEGEIEGGSRPSAHSSVLREMSGVVEPERVRIREDAFCRLNIEVDGKCFEDVRAVRVFPLSGKADYISLLDRKQKEVLLLAHPDRLDKESQRVLARALEKMYYVAQILQVHEITEKMGVSHWQVTTEQGYAEFEVVERDRIRRLPGRRVLIQDADGNRFEIKDVARLDPRSMALVQSEL